MHKQPSFWITVFLAVQPVLDALSYFTQGSLLTLGFRFGILGVLVLMGLFSGQMQRSFCLLGCISLFLGLGHLWAISQAGIQDLPSDLVNFVRVLQLPWATVSMLALMRADPNCRSGIKTGMAASFFLIVSIVLLSNLTGTEPHTYEDGSGILGWFNNTNAQSAILSMVVPVAVSWLYTRYRTHPLPFWGASCGGFLLLYLLGTRLAFLALVSTGVGLGIVIAMQQQADRKTGYLLLGLSALFCLLIPISPMAQHQEQYRAVQANRQAQINQELAAYDLPSLYDSGLTETELAHRKQLWVDALTPVYTLYAPDFVAHFGAARTIALCDYSSVIGDITEQRPKKLKFAKLLLEDSPVSARIFGLELSRFLVGEQNYDVENDFHGIYYLYGVAGLAALLLFLGTILFRSTIVTLRDFHNKLTAEAMGTAIAIGMALLHALFTAGILRRPNASFYLAACLSLFYVPRKK